jgi:hypothetical protein
MKKAFLIIVFLFAAANSFSQSTVYVKGYTKSNGSYTQGHYKTSPNSSKIDNYSTQGNYNPYTGSYGTKRVQEYRPTSTYSSFYTSPSTYTSSRTYTTPVYTGPRGGTYYINSNGNKTYIK